MEQRAAWRDIELTGDYRVSFSLIGGQVLHTIPRGNAGRVGIPRLFEARRSVLEQVDRWERPYCEIKDYEKVVLRHSRLGRTQFTELLSQEYERGKLLGYWGYGGPAMFRWIMATAKRMSGHADAPCFFVPDYRAAILQALQATWSDETVEDPGPASRRHREEWVLDLDGYHAHFEIWDDEILYGRSSGVLRKHHVAPFFEVIDRVLREPDCFPDGAYSQLSDVTALRRIDFPALREFHSRYLALHKRMRCRGVVLYSKSRAIQATTKLARHLLPYPYLHADEWTEALRLARDLPRAPRRRRRLARLFGRQRAADAEMQHLVDELVLHAGAINWHVQGPVAPVEDEQNPLAAIYALLRVLKLDFDTMHRDREQMQQQVLQAAKLSSIGRLTAGVAHELNSPLTAVLGYAQAMQEQGSRADTVAYAERIIRAARRMRDVIDQLAGYSRTEPGGPAESLDVNRTVEEVLSVIAPLLDKRRVSVECELEQGLPAVWCNRTHFQSMLYNLLTNSSDAYAQASTSLADPNPPEKRVRLTSRLRSDWVEIQCQDWGCGMSAEVASKALDPFFTTKDVGEGTGLGLYVTHLLAGEYGGKVLIDSIEQQGTTLTLAFPVYRDRPPRPEKSSFEST